MVMKLPVLWLLPVWELADANREMRLSLQTLPRVSSASTVNADNTAYVKIFFCSTELTLNICLFPNASFVKTCINSLAVPLS